MRLPQNSTTVILTGMCMGRTGEVASRRCTRLKALALLSASLMTGGWVVSAAPAPTVWLWHEEGMPDSLPGLAERLRMEGFALQLTDGATLVTKGLKPGAPDVLVLPYGDRYPAAVAAALNTPAARGCALVVTGGERSFDQPIYSTAAGARTLTATGDELACLAQDAAWNRPLAGPDDRVRTEVVGNAVRVTLGLAAYAYAGIDLPPMDAADAVLELELRGNPPVQRLSLDLHEKDGTRWKQIVPVSPEWTRHRVHFAQFLPYASPRAAGREGPSPTHVTRLSVGSTHTMAGRKGDCVFELRGVRVLRAQVTTAQVAATPPFVDANLSVAHWFGAQHVGESRSKPAPQLRDGMRRAQAETPFLYAHTAPLQGSRWAVFDLAAVSAERRETDADRVVQAVRALATGVWQQTPRPRFRAAEDRVVMDVCLPLMNPGTAQATVTATLHMGGTEPISRTFTLPPRQSKTIDMILAEGIAAPLLTQTPLDLRVETRASTGPVVGDARFRFDARAALRGICDTMLAHAKEDGRLHGYSFIDNRGIRVLLGGYEIFGDSRYRDAALRWGMTQLTEQREDGGYRMGYGITSKGEECYVADGGEIVVGILRLAAYAEPDLRERLLASADRYMRYRESFRVAEGGIGVGWCLFDYGQRPPTPLNTPTRIYAPERNTYTIGCSLAGAYGHAALRGQPDLFRQAAADADWLMPRTSKLNGAFIESFVFAHAFAVTPERRKLYADYLHSAFLDPMLSAANKERTWWFDGQGRHALNLFGLVYCAHRLEERAELTAEIYRALCAMFSSDAPRSIPEILAGQQLRQPEWLAISYGTLGLVDAVSPLASMARWTDGPPRETSRKTDHKKHQQKDKS